MIPELALQTAAGCEGSEEGRHPSYNHTNLWQMSGRSISPVLLPSRLVHLCFHSLVGFALQARFRLILLSAAACEGLVSSPILRPLGLIQSCLAIRASSVVLRHVW